jgi:prepilin-type N-terminal cleavage/methylation domain-containing protein
MTYDSKFNNKGFTLLELLLAISLLSLIITITVGIFVSGSKTQRKIIELSAAQREGGYLMETISREIRMAKAINSDQEGNNDSDVEFTNYDGDPTIYELSGGQILRNTKPISSSDVTIENLTFYVSDDFNDVQPLITIVMKVKAKDTSILLQDSIALRIY